MHASSQNAPGARYSIGHNYIDAGAQPAIRQTYFDFQTTGHGRPIFEVARFADGQRQRLPGHQNLLGWLGLASVYADVYLATLDGGAPPVKLPLEASVPRYAAGYLWYVRNHTLMAQPLDVKDRELAGPAVPVAEQVRVDNAPFRRAIFSVAASGTLVYQRDPTPGFEHTWFDRTGRRLGTLGTPADYADVDLSPDATRASVSVAPESTAKRDLWIFDLARGLRSRFTFDEMRPIRGPIWSPDG